MIHICYHGQVPCEIYAMCLGSGPLKTDVIGVGIRACSGCQVCFPSVLQVNSFLRPAWNMNGGRVGMGLGNPGKLLWQGSAIDWSLDSTEKEGFIHRNYLAWKDSELWAFVPGGGLAEARWASACENSCFKLICSVLSAVKCYTLPTRHLQKLKQGTDDHTDCFLSFGETLGSQDSFRPSFCCFLE